MFIRTALAKFEWKGQPDGLPALFIESLLLRSDTYNFAVVNFKSKNEKNTDANGEFWGFFNVLEYEPMYRRPKKIQVTNGQGEAFSTTDFVLFNNFKNYATLPSRYINYYSQMIAQINRALNQHIDASQLIATIYASSKKEADDIKNAFKGFDGVKVVEHKTALVDGGKKADIVQFEIEPRLKELEDLKHEIEKDLFLRLGVHFGTDKTHITDANLSDSEQAIDLINEYELKLRKDFEARYNAWKGSDALKVEIHSITAKNSIREREEGNDNDDDSNNND